MCYFQKRTTPLFKLSTIHTHHLKHIYIHTHTYICWQAVGENSNIKSREFTYLIKVSLGLTKFPLLTGSSLQGITRQNQIFEILISIVTLLCLTALANLLSVINFFPVPSQPSNDKMCVLLSYPGFPSLLAPITLFLPMSVAGQCFEMCAWSWSLQPVKKTPGHMQAPHPSFTSTCQPRAERPRCPQDQ